MASSSPPVEKSTPSSSTPAVSSSSMKSPGSVAFSSAPVAPVVVNSHNRRQSEAASWSQTPAALVADGGGHANTRQQSMQRNGGSRGSSPGSFGSSEPSDASGDEEDRSQHSESHPSRQSSATLSLPAISGAALLQLRSGNNSIQPAEKRGDAQYASGSSGAGGMAAPGRSSGYYRRSQSRSRERPDPTDVHNRWRNADPQPSTTSSQGETSSKAHSHLPQHDSNSREDAGSPAFSASSGMRGSADPSSPDDREIRIMFHGREIYADDLIGLRVAKTFVGHGRFLGQVVKFDEPTSLYTIVYADGDAEELNIDSTIQILIQDEIERADPSLPPVSSVYAKEAYATSNSPESARTSAPSGIPQAPPQSSLQQRPPPPPIAQHGPPPPSSSRPLVQISEREAQFVVGLFENHALPALLRDGWRIQTSASGTEQRFFAPPGNFPGAGGVFPTALSVVELIASDNELLSMCFPTNVHSAILSLFPESSRVLHESSHPRKRASSGHGDADAYDGKRQRAAREDSGHGSTAPQMRGVAPLNPRSRGMNVEQPRGSYVSEDMHRDRDREPYAADRVLPLSSSSVDRFGPGRQQSVQDRGGDDYRRGPPPGDSMRGAPSDIPGSSRWHGGGGGGHAESGVPDYRQQAYADSPGWRNREMASSRGGPYAPSSSSSYPDGPSHRMQSRSDEPSSQYGDRSQPHPTMRPGPGSADGSSYRYHDSPARGSPGDQQQPLHRRVSSGGRSMPPSSSDDQGQASRNELSAEYRNAGNAGDRHALRRGDPSGGPTVVSSNSSSANNRGPSFSMMDVDRNSHPRASIPSSSASLMEHARAVSDSSKHPKWDSQHQQHRRPEQQGYDQQREHGRSLHASESGSNQGYVPPPSHHHRHHGHHQVPTQHHRQHHHQRSASNYDSSKGSGAPSSTVASGGRVSTGMSDHRTGSPGNNQNTAADAPPPPHQM